MVIFTSTHSPLYPTAWFDLHAKTSVMLRDNRVPRHISARYPNLLVHGSRYNPPMVKLIFPLLIAVIAVTGCSARSERPIHAASDLAIVGREAEHKVGRRDDLLMKRLQEASQGQVQISELGPTRSRSQLKRPVARSAERTDDDDDDEDEGGNGICPMQTPEGRAILLQSAEGRALLDQQ